MKDTTALGIVFVSGAALFGVVYALDAPSVPPSLKGKKSSAECSGDACLCPAAPIQFKVPGADDVAPPASTAVAAVVSALAPARYLTLRLAPADGAPVATAAVSLKLPDGVVQTAAADDGTSVTIGLVPGRGVKLSTVAAVISGTGRAVDDATRFEGRIQFTGEGLSCDCCGKKLSDSVLKNPAVESCQLSLLEGRRGTFVLTIRKGASLAVKDLRDAIAEVRFKLIDVEVRCPRSQS